MIPYHYDVLDPIIHPVPARAGDALVVRPGHPTRPLVVLRPAPGGWVPVHIGPPNYGAVIGLELDGAIRLASPAAPSLATDPLVQTA